MLCSLPVHHITRFLAKLYSLPLRLDGCLQCFLFVCFVSISVESDPRALPCCLSSVRESRKHSCISKHRAVFLQLEAGRRGETGVSGTDGDCLMYPTCQERLVEWKVEVESPSTLLSSSLFVPLLLLCRLPSIYTPLGKKIKTTHDFLVNVLCCMCIMEALGANAADPFHVSPSSVLDKEQPVAEIFSENRVM